VCLLSKERTVSIKESIFNNKKYYEVYVNGFDSSGRRMQWRKIKIESKVKAEKIEFEFKRELAQLREKKVPFRWLEWFNICMSRMKMDSRHSTIINYNCTVGKWAHPHWRDREISSITKADVYEVIFVKSEGLQTPNSRRNLLAMLKRIFHMAIEEGHLDRNPVVGIKIKIPELVQKVLTNSEAEIFLKEAKAVNHRFYEIWVMALLTGMRSGEMFALKWTDIDFDARIISV
jgi:integrase